MSDLTPSERERLEMLAEEAAEIVQAVTKILRHGKLNYKPCDPDCITNIEHLRTELYDLYGVVYGMQEAGDIPITDVESALSRVKTSWERKLRYAYHQEE